MGSSAFSITMAPWINICASVVSLDATDIIGHTSLQHQ
jgi:hypothetical protein